MLQEVSVPISTYVKEWQCKDILNELTTWRRRICARSGARTCLKGVKALPGEICPSPPRLHRDEGDELVKVGLSAKSGVNKESPEQV